MKCLKCNQEKSEDAFYRRRNGRVIRPCKACKRTTKSKGTQIERLYEGLRKGVEAERVALKYFMDRGYFARAHQSIGVPGPDLTLMRDGLTTTVEVKAVHEHKGCWYVSAVSERRKNDNWIAMVFPSGSVVVEDMSIHLAKCGKNGKRMVRLDEALAS